jgi:hypothetical protein
MQASAPPTADYGSCCRCAQWARGRNVRFGVGPRSRGLNPRTGRPNRRIITVDEVFVCDACERRLIWVGVGRRIDVHRMGVMVVPALAVAWSLWRGVVDWRHALELTVGAAVIVLGTAGLVFRWHARRSSALRELLFETRRNLYAAQLNRPEESLAAYPPPTADVPA